jgi:aspartate kinase
VATGVPHVDHVARVTVSLPDGDGGAHMEAQTRVYRTMADADVSLDMFTPCGPSLVFNIPEGDVAAAMRALDALELPYGVETGLAKVTLVGAGMHGVPGVMARLAEALRSAGVGILQAADSHATISVLVWQNDRSAAVSALHREFDLGAPHPVESDPDADPATQSDADTSTRG